MQSRDQPRQGPSLRKEERYLGTRLSIVSILYDAIHVTTCQNTASRLLVLHAFFFHLVYLAVQTLIHMNLDGIFRGLRKGSTSFPELGKRPWERGWEGIEERK